MVIEIGTVSERNWIVGVGSALVDILSHEDDQFLEAIGAIKGGMQLVDMADIENAMSKTLAEPVIVPGGSACNTMVGVAKLGGKARFIGKCGQGPMGRRLSDGLKQSNVEPLLARSTSPTGRVFSIITPDAQRSFLTYLGAAAEARPDEMMAAHFDGAAIVHLEGYLLHSESLIMAALKYAKAAGALVSIDLASFTVVAAARALLEHVVDRYADIVMANEEEARAYTGAGDELEALDILSQKAEIAVVKVGARGSYIRHAGTTTRVAPMGDGTAVDTTGAGDLWAAGFLFGLVSGMDIASSGALASSCGYEVCQVVGAAIPEEGWDRIRKRLKP
ncbi:MAG: adenosine kinase [Pseudomonadota bacterium]